jgi:hypothetical protein
MLRRMSDIPDAVRRQAQPLLDFFQRADEPGFLALFREKHPGATDGELMAWRLLEATQPGNFSALQDFTALPPAQRQQILQDTLAPIRALREVDSAATDILLEQRSFSMVASELGRAIRNNGQPIPGLTQEEMRAMEIEGNREQRSRQAVCEMIRNNPTLSEAIRDLRVTDPELGDLGRVMPDCDLSLSPPPTPRDTAPDPQPLLRFRG